MTRRNFIVWYMAGLMGAIVAAVAAPLFAYLLPAPDPNMRRRAIPVQLPSPPAGLPEGGALRFDAPAGSAFVMRDGGGVNGPGHLTFGGFLVRTGDRLVALAITCPHLGCSYALNAGARRFECPCHGSRFSLDGRVLHGPAVNPLSHLTWRPAPDATGITVEGVDLPQ